MPPPRAIVALSDAEIADFLPGPLWNQLEQLLPGYRRLRLPLANGDDWVKCWKETPAEILVSAWQTPSLNSTLRLEDLESLKYVCHLTGTIRKLVPRELISRGLVVTNWGESVSVNVAECALMLILMTLRRASAWAVAMHRDGEWKKPDTYTQSLIGRRVGIHGFGFISRALVPMLRPFTSDIQAFSPHVPQRFFDELAVKRLDSLETLFSTSDVVAELAAAIPENHHLVTEQHLRSIPEGGVFVNVGRGMVVDEQALVRVAREGKLQIGLDVYEQEPLPADSPLRGLANVTLLPHIGGPTRDRRRDCGAVALKNLRAFLKGEKLDSAISLEVYDRST